MHVQIIVHAFREKKVARKKSLNTHTNNRTCVPGYNEHGTRKKWPRACTDNRTCIRGGGGIKEIVCVFQNKIITITKKKLAERTYQ
jgi:hypothetical protein